MYLAKDFYIEQVTSDLFKKKETTAKLPAQVRGVNKLRVL